MINIVHGDADAGRPLSAHPDVDVVVFTGSYQVGKAIQRQAANEAHKFVATEMGGKNAVMVLEDADLEIAVPACVLSAFKTTGQRCVTSGRLIVDAKIVDEFQERFLAMVDRIKIGNGLDEDVFMGPLIEQESIKKYELHNQKATEEGAQVLREGACLPEANTPTAGLSSLSSIA